jgi:hypothetical protein
MNFSSYFCPSGPAPPAQARYAPQAAGSPLGPLGPSRVGVFAERRIPFDFAHFGREAFSLSHHSHVGPACQLHPLPHAGRPLPLLLVASGHPTPPGLQPRDAKRGLHSPPRFPLLISPLTPNQAAPLSMVLRPLPPAVSPSLALACPSPATIKGRGAAPGHHHTHPALICSLPSPQRPPHRAPPSPVVPHHHPAVSIPTPPPLAAGEAHRRPLPLFPQPQRGSMHGGGPFRPFSGEPPPRRCPWSTASWTRSTKFSVEN